MAHGAVACSCPVADPLIGGSEAPGFPATSSVDRRAQMATIEGEIYIDRPSEVDFEIVADERNEPLFNPNMTAVSLLSDVQIGSRSRFIATSEALRSTFHSAQHVPSHDEVSRYDS